MPPYIIPISIVERCSVVERNQFARIGIPFSRGQVKSLENVILKSEKDFQIPFQSSPTAIWDDASIKWALIEFQTSFNNSESNEYFLEIHPEVQTQLEPSNCISWIESKNGIEIDTSTSRFTISKEYFGSFTDVYNDGEVSPITGSEFILEGVNGKLYYPKLLRFTPPEKHEVLTATFLFQGAFITDSGEPFLNFQLQLTVYANSPLCELKSTVHNPDRARHKGGFWDLGDPGSKSFNSLAFELKQSNITALNWKMVGETNFRQLCHNQIRLYQDSSGGDLWNHSLHTDKNGEPSVTFRGYKLTLDHVDVEFGNQASPIFQSIDRDNNKVCLHLLDFWQNFPSAISSRRDKLVVELFPKTTRSPFELQGGERKTQTILVDLSGCSHGLEQRVRSIRATIPLSYYASSNTIPWLPENLQPGEIDIQIANGIDGANNFFIKRETSDEYGWRNFGELWADHETIEHGNDSSLVSHYNNQYDPLYGFLIQFLISGNPKWFELAKDLAIHIVDIDFYDTSKDRNEYNFGLFWHTDHYLDGRSCTHRTFSKDHLKSVHVEQSGGGPANEHSYTSGLLLFYFLTGEKSLKRVVQKQLTWTKFANDRTGALFQLLNNFARTDIPCLIKMFKGTSVLKYQYQFGRGTANYINCILDNVCFSKSHHLLGLASSVIQNTIGPKDIIDSRDLLSKIEENWHYTIFLQTVARFLKEKEAVSQLDNDYWYARRTFSHYLEWMLKFEKPYLDNQDQLVYQNLTWVAQDCRKLALFNVYTNYCSKETLPMLQKKSGELNRYIFSKLGDGIEANSSRVLSILLQSYLQIKVDPQTNDVDLSGSQNSNSAQFPSPIDTPLKRVLRFLYDLYKTLKSLNLKNEIRWLKTRFLE
jgi:hypothetical protein